MDIHLSTTPDYILPGPKFEYINNSSSANSSNAENNIYIIINTDGTMNNATMINETIDDGTTTTNIRPSIQYNFVDNTAHYYILGIIVCFLIMFLAITLHKYIDKRKKTQINTVYSISSLPGSSRLEIPPSLPERNKCFEKGNIPFWPVTSPGHDNKTYVTDNSEHIYEPAYVMGPTYLSVI